MGTRKNAKFLTAAERENFVKACVLMKADIVNPAAAPAARYSKWDEFDAIHWMIQDAFAPGSISVNFGHGGSGSYSFLSWHRFFLHVFEQQLQSYVPGVMLPYWDWTDPSSIMTHTFLGPNGTTSSEVRSRYFAPNAPGTAGGAAQMSNPQFSPFDPFFYLHHCNIDRLWTMWQMDGHASEYPASGGNPHHNRGDIMYPWTGGAAGYGTHAAIATSIPMPDFSAIGAKLNGDTLDFRTAFGVTYDTLAIVGIGLDRTGSMTGLTPDPMTTGAPDVTKWTAAKRGVSAFLQDCETVQNSGITYVMAGIKTLRQLGAGDDFASVFSSPGY